MRLLGKWLGLVLILAPVLAWAAPADLVDLELWSSATSSENGPPPDDWKVYQIIRDRLGINLKLVILPATPTDQNAKISTAAAANRLADWFLVSREVWVKLVLSKLVAPTDDLWKKMPTRVAKYYADPDLVQLITLNGKRYGFPEPGSSIAPVVEGLVIRKDWLDRLKLKIPTTTEELFQVAKAFTERDPDGNGKNDTYGYGAFLENTSIDLGLGRRFYPILGAFGLPLTWDTNPKSFSLAVRRPEFFDAMVYLRRLVEQKLLDPDWATLKKEEFRLRWKEGKFGIMFEQFAALAMKPNYELFDKNFPNGEWVPIPAIKGPKGIAYGSVAAKGIRISAVSAKAARDPRKLDAIARLQEWLASDEGYYLMGWGEKGVNFNLDASGRVTFDGIDPKKRTDAKEMIPFTQLRHLVALNDERELYGRYTAFTSLAGRTIAPLSFLKFFNSQPMYNGTAASFIATPANFADFSRYYSEGLLKFLNGQALTKPNWEAFIKGLDAIGAAKWEADARDYLKSIGQL